MNGSVDTISVLFRLRRRYPSENLPRIANANNYALAAKEFNCSYGQVYSWVKKYQAQGVEGLYDRRGRNKPVDELTELEKLQAENRLLKAQAKQHQMEIDFLKKLDAVERR